MVWAKNIILVCCFFLLFSTKGFSSSEDPDQAEPSEDSSFYSELENPEWHGTPEQQFQSLILELHLESEWSHLDSEAKARVQHIFNACLIKNKRIFSSQIVGPNGVTQKDFSSWVSEPVRIVRHAVQSAIHAPLRNLAKNHIRNPIKNPMTRILDAMILYKMRDAHLNAKQGVCLSVCAASNAYPYKLTTKQVFSSAFSNVEQTWTHQQGICWDYTRLASHLLKQIRQELLVQQNALSSSSPDKILEFRTRSNLPHSFLQVRFEPNGKWLGVDPTPESLDDARKSGFCNFIDPSLPKERRAMKIR